MRGVAMGVVAVIVVFAMYSAPAAGPQSSDYDQSAGHAPVNGLDLAHSSPGAPSREAGGRAVAHFPGGVLAPRGSKKRVPSVDLYRTGRASGEPTIGVFRNGTILLQTYNTQQWPAAASEVLRSVDEGATWDEVTPAVAGAANTHTHTLDPYLYLDEETGRAFTSDWLAPCHRISSSDDLGETWETQPSIACQVSDHQTFFGGNPSVSKLRGYPNVLYFCGPGDPDTELQLGGSSTICLKSLDGGDSWRRAGVAFPDRPGCDAGATGHGVVARDGTVYLGLANYCGDKPHIAFTRNEGETWTRVQVADLESTWHEGSVAVDRSGNVYYLWTSADRDRLPYLTVSRDGGLSWSDPLMVGVPGIKEAALPAIVAGDRGRVAFAYMGSTTSPGPPFNGSYKDVIFDGYLSLSTNVLAKRPLFFTAPIDENGLITGRCRQDRCGLAYDFIDITIGPDGTAWAAMVDGCFEEACLDAGGGTAIPEAKVRPGEGIVARLVGAPPLN